MSNKSFSASAVRNDLIALKNSLPLGTILLVMGVWKRLKPRYCSVEMYESRRTELHRTLDRMRVEGVLEFYSGRFVAAQKRYLGDDGIHPSPEGYRQLARILSQAISLCASKQGW